MTEIKKPETNTDIERRVFLESYEMARLGKKICDERTLALADSDSELATELATIYGLIKSGIELSESEFRALEEKFEELLEKARQMEEQTAKKERFELVSQLTEETANMHTFSKLCLFMYSNEQVLLKTNQSGVSKEVVLELLSALVPILPKKVVFALLSELQAAHQPDEVPEEFAETPGAPNLKP